MAPQQGDVTVKNSAANADNGCMPRAGARARTTRQMRNRSVTRAAERTRRAPEGALAWLPLALVCTLVVASALGLRIVPGAGAVTGSTTVTITGSVDREVHMSGAGCNAATDLDIGTLTPGDPAVETSGSCDITFGTNNSGAGADLNVSEDPGAPASPTDAMKCVTAACGFPGSPSSLPDYQGNGIPAGSSAFGMRLASASSATAVWTVNASSAPSGWFYDVQDAADTACQTSSMSDGTCSFRFAAGASGTQLPGSYQALVLIEATAR